MTKRRNPWSDDTPLQLKTHISTKEVANGVDGTIYKNSIHGHTKQLLLSGAKEFYSKACLKEVENIANNNLVANGDYSIPQKMITAFFPKSSTKPKSDKRTKAKLAMLNFCNHSSGRIVQCEFCSKSICSSCGRTCNVCDKQFCSFCSVLSYEECYDIAICLTCKT